MAHGIEVYNNGKATLFTATPYNLVYVVGWKNLQAGTFTATIPTNTDGGTFYALFGNHRTRDPDREIDLGGTPGSTDRFEVDSITVSTNSITITLIAAGDANSRQPGVDAVTYSIYVSR